ncbi:hypothetical protein LCGC14_1471740 [marine sediment metagenome]|uniref:DNA topoisomerase type IA zn finger domain-containing protein n=1 Tax=marine sediment metagenome TaxID=412755 RepID=A0A0F9JCU1_9ZZZZ
MADKAAPTCPYCGDKALLKDSVEVYGGRSFGRMWICKNYPKCDSYVGLHPGTTRSLGRMANKELRTAKKKAHAAFDRLWKYKIKSSFCNKKAARGAGYAWLAEELNIDPHECHIGMFDIELCKRVMKLCQPYLGGNP